jgi:hypothetical protein
MRVENNNPKSQREKFSINYHCAVILYISAGWPGYIVGRAYGRGCISCISKGAQDDDDD